MGINRGQPGKEEKDDSKRPYKERRKTPPNYPVIPDSSTNEQSNSSEIPNSSK